MTRLGAPDRRGGSQDQIAAASPFLDTVIERLQTMPVGTIDQDAERGRGGALAWGDPCGDLANAFGQAASQVAVRSSPRRRGGVNERRRQRSLTMRPPSRGERDGPDHLDVPEVMRQLARQDAVAGVEHLAVRRDAPVRAGPEPWGRRCPCSRSTRSPAP